MDYSSEVIRSFENDITFQQFIKLLKECAILKKTILGTKLIVPGHKYNTDVMYFFYHVYREAKNSNLIKKKYSIQVLVAIFYMFLAKKRFNAESRGIHYGNSIDDIIQNTFGLTDTDVQLISSAYNELDAFLMEYRLGRRNWKLLTAPEKIIKSSDVKSAFGH